MFAKKEMHDKKGGNKMLKRRKQSFEQLFMENKEEIMKDKAQLEIIEKRLEEKAEIANKIKK